ncbi:MAG TPA: hypothetical protein VGM88_32910 [Kofleriaceae bacterium]|jgi:hypothetical protein
MTNQLEGISISSLEGVVGGVTKQQWSQTMSQASQVCPNTAQKYSSLDPSTLNRSKAQSIGNECIREAGPFMGPIAGPKINQAIDQAFPKH